MNASHSLSDAEREEINLLAQSADDRLENASVFCQNLYDNDERAAFPGCVMRDCTAALVAEMRALRLTLTGLLEAEEL